MLEGKRRKGEKEIYGPFCGPDLVVVLESPAVYQAVAQIIEMIIVKCVPEEIECEW